MARETGWSEYFIMWELPLARAHAYMHAMLRFKGVPTQWAMHQKVKTFLEQFDEV